MPPKKRTKKRGSQEREVSTSPEVDELTCLPKTLQSQQAPGVRDLLVVGVVDHVEMSDTEQGDIELKTQHNFVRRTI